MRDMSQVMDEVTDDLEARCVERESGLTDEQVEALQRLRDELAASL